jgi:hypothetical protein
MSRKKSPGGLAATWATSTKTLANDISNVPQNKIDVNSELRRYLRNPQKYALRVKDAEIRLIPAGSAKSGDIKPMYAEALIRCAFEGDNERRLMSGKADDALLAELKNWLIHAGKASKGS